MFWVGGVPRALLAPHPAPQGRTPPVTSPRWDPPSGDCPAQKGIRGGFWGAVGSWGGAAGIRGHPPSLSPPPPLPQVAGWEAQKKEQPMFGEEQHVRYGDPRHPLNPAGHPMALLGTPGSPKHLLCSPGSADRPCSGGRSGGPESLPGSLGHPMCYLGPQNSMDTPCPPVGIGLCPCTPSVPQVPQVSTGFPGVPQTPHVPCGQPRNSMSLQGSHGHPMSLVEHPRSPCHPGTPDPCRISRGPSPSGPRRRPVGRGGAIGTAAPWGGR